MAGMEPAPEPPAAQGGEGRQVIGIPLEDEPRVGAVQADYTHTWLGLSSMHLIYLPFSSSVRF